MKTKAPTARERARVEITAEILSAARVRLRQHGPGELSLRAVARDVGMVSSAVYRYFSSRDELLTALLIEAYNELGQVVEAADAQITNRACFATRWRISGHAIRNWAVTHPGEYALLYGSPVPGYVAPHDTIPAATRVTLVLVNIVIEANVAGAQFRALPPSAPTDVASTMADALAFIGDIADPKARNPGLAVRIVSAWSAIFGTISFELYGHLVGSVSDYERYFDHVIAQHCEDLGLHDVI